MHLIISDFKITDEFEYYLLALEYVILNHAINCHTVMTVQSFLPEICQNDF